MLEFTGIFKDRIYWIFIQEIEFTGCLENVMLADILSKAPCFYCELVSDYLKFYEETNEKHCFKTVDLDRSGFSDLAFNLMDQH